MRRSLDSPVVGDYMVRSPICAEPWQPISFIRQQMLANSFSFLPVKRATEWWLVSDLEIAGYLGTETKERKRRLVQTLETAGTSLQRARLCAVDTPLEAALRMMAGEQRPLLVCATPEDFQALVGIITHFDLL